jgi:hypothetical protein
MSERERGERPWSVVQLVATAAAYGVSPAAMLPDCAVSAPPAGGDVCADLK